MAIRIITDSTVDVGNQYSDRFIVVPLTVTFGETEFIDGVTLDKTEFYQKLEERESGASQDEPGDAGFICKGIPRSGGQRGRSGRDHRHL